jgi:hypothetical protein
VQVIQAHRVTMETREAIFNLFAAYVHTVPLEELLATVERAQRVLFKERRFIISVAYKWVVRLDYLLKSARNNKCDARP